MITEIKDPPRGRLVAIEAASGIDHAVIAEHVAEALAAMGPVDPGPVVARQPTDTAWGTIVAHHDDWLVGRSLALAWAADRTEHMESELDVHLECGGDVVCAGYVATSLVLHSLDGVSMDDTWRYNQHLPQPDITVYIEADTTLMEQAPLKRTERSRLESLAVPARERKSRTEAFRFLQSQGWKQYRLTSPPESLREMATQVAGLLDEVE